MYNLIYDQFLIYFQYKEFLQLYNKLTQNCFIACVTNMNYRKVTAEEVRMNLKSLSVTRAVSLCWSNGVQCMVFKYQERSILFYIHSCAFVNLRCNQIRSKNLLLTPLITYCIQDNWFHASSFYMPFICGLFHRIVPSSPMET